MRDKLLSLMALMRSVVSKLRKFLQGGKKKMLVARWEILRMPEMQKYSFY
jgi:hypothetical protein